MITQAFIFVSSFWKPVNLHIGMFRSLFVESVTEGLQTEPSFCHFAKCLTVKGRYRQLNFPYNVYLLMAQQRQMINIK